MTLRTEAALRDEMCECNAKMHGKPLGLVQRALQQRLHRVLPGELTEEQIRVFAVAIAGETFAEEDKRPARAA